MYRPELVEIAAPVQGVFRLAHRSAKVFDPPAWQFAYPSDGTFGNRFDDPSLEDGYGPDMRFRMVYCATHRPCVFMESTARFRRSVSTLVRISSDGDVADNLRQQDASRGLIPAKWRIGRHIGHAQLDPSLRFIDLGATATLNHLRHVLADVVVELGLDDIDLSAVTGPHRRLTQRIARYVYEQVDGAGKPRFAGIRYLSHHGDNQECWALFDTRMVLRETIVELNILPDDADLLAVARMFGLTIEVLDGQYLRP